jgi:hypothetical protein
MVLGYILICGMGSLEPGSIEGCRVFTIPFPTVAECEESRENFLLSPNLRDQHYVDDSRCIVIGTGA